MKILVSTITNFRPDLLEIQMSLVFKLKNPDDKVHYIVGSQNPDPIIVDAIQKVCHKFDSEYITIDGGAYWDGYKTFASYLQSLEGYEEKWFLEEDVIPIDNWRVYGIKDKWTPPACRHWVSGPRAQLLCWKNEYLPDKEWPEIPSYRMLKKSDIPKCISDL